MLKYSLNSFTNSSKLLLRPQFFA